MKTTKNKFQSIQKYLNMLLTSENKNLLSFLIRGKFIKRALVSKNPRSKADLGGTGKCTTRLLFRHLLPSCL